MCASPYDRSTDGFARRTYARIPPSIVQLCRKVGVVKPVAILFVVLLSFGVLPVFAQDNASVASAYIPPISLPSEVRLEGLRPVYQQMNRCSSAALTIELSYYGFAGTYDDVIRALNPNSEDVAVRLDEMVGFAESQGLRGIERVGGTVDLLKALVAAGFPVLVENVYYDGPDAFKDWMSHNRVIMGYDDSQQALLSYDSLLGNGPDNTGRPIPYEDMDTRWRAFNRDFLVIYRPEQESQLHDLMGLYWDETSAAETALAQSMAELETPYADSFSLFNAGESLVLLGRYDEAAGYFDRARATGLPWRMMWYMYGPFEAYYHVGRYDDMLQLARDVIATTPGVEEMYYYAGLAYEGLGDPQRAKANYEAAVWRNNGFTDAINALSRLAAAGVS